jgi:molybdenum cofactor cytidylyltransferase
MCGTVVATVLEAGLRPVIVAGYRGEELAESFADRPELAVVLNDNWELGMLGSIRTGVDFILQNCLEDGEGDTSGFFVVPADMPRVPVQAFALITESLAIAGVKPSRDGAARASGAVFAARSGRLGHPVWIPAAFIPALRELDPGSRLRDYLLGQPWTSIEVDDDGIFEDLDTPEAYAAALAAVMRNTTGT